MSNVERNFMTQRTLLIILVAGVLLLPPCTPNLSHRRHRPPYPPPSSPPFPPPTSRLRQVSRPTHNMTGHFHVIFLSRNYTNPGRNERTFAQLREFYKRTFFFDRNSRIEFRVVFHSVFLPPAPVAHGGSWELQEAVRRFKETRGGRLPQLIISDSINSEIALVASQYKIPLSGCSRNCGVPRGLGITQPIWTTLPPIEHHKPIILFVEKSRDINTAIFLTFPHLCPMLINDLQNTFDQLQPPWPIVIELKNAADLNALLARSDLSQRRLFVCLQLDESERSANWVGRTIDTIRLKRQTNSKLHVLSSYRLVEKRRERVLTGALHRAQSVLENPHFNEQAPYVPGRSRSWHCFTESLGQAIYGLLRNNRVCRIADPNRLLDCLAYSDKYKWKMK